MTHLKKHIKQPLFHQIKGFSLLTAIVWAWGCTGFDLPDNGGTPGEEIPSFATAIFNYVPGDLSATAVLNEEQDNVLGVPDSAGLSIGFKGRLELFFGDAPLIPRADQDIIVYAAGTPTTVGRLEGKAQDNDDWRFMGCVSPTEQHYRITQNSFVNSAISHLRIVLDKSGTACTGAKAGDVLTIDAVGKP
jgi:hypothetical protein